MRTWVAQLPFLFSSYWTFCTSTAFLPTTNKRLPLQRMLDMPQETSNYEAVVEQSRGHFLAWANDNCIDLGGIINDDACTTSAQEEEAILQSMVSAILDDNDDARVVALSEGCHNSRPQMLWHTKLARHLVEHHNFTTVVTETGLPESRRIWEYVQGNNSVEVVDNKDELYRSSLNQMYGAWKEGRELIEWMREYNMIHHHDDDDENREQRELSSLQYYGIDIGGFYQDWKTPMNDIFGYLQRYAFTAKEAFRILKLIKRWDEPFGAVMEHDARKYYTENMTAKDRSDLAILLDDALQVFSDMEKLYVDRSGRFEYEWARQSLISMQLAERYYRNYMDRCKSCSNESVGLNGREIAMHQNILWVLQRQRPESKIIWINHVVHTKTETQYQGDLWGFFTPAGAMLRQSLGGKGVVTVGLVYGGGEYWKDWQQGREKRTVEAVPDAVEENGLERTLASLTKKTKNNNESSARQNVFIPWFQAPVDAWPWLQSMCSIRENDYVLQLKPLEWQACIYMNCVSPATPADSILE